MPDGKPRKNYSTITMTRKLVYHILNNREDKIPTIAVVIDLSKAFDTISHKGLITKLQKYFFFFFFLLKISHHTVLRH